MKNRILLVLALSLAACGGAPAPREDSPAPRAEVTYPNFSDNDPHPWAGQDPSRHPVHGIDVSRFQTGIDWAQARANGVNFAFIKATEGGDLVDPMFKDHWRGAGSAGVKRGAYLFYYHCRPGAEQARWFFKHVPRTCTIRRDAGVIRADAAVIIQMMTEHYGTKPIIYTTVDFFEENQLWKLTGAEFWLRSVAAHPSDRYPGQHWAFWQYTSTGLIPGITGEVDINAFSGGREEWASWLARRAQ
jgi:lysozyme